MRRMLALAFVVLGLVHVPVARGADLVYVLDTFINGSNGLLTGTPKAEFTNLANPDQVRLTMTLDDLSSFDEFAVWWFFNFNPLFDSGPGLDIAYDGANSNGPPESSISYTIDPNNLYPDLPKSGVFDFMFSFDMNGYASQLNPPEYVSYILTRAGGLRASDFNFLTSSNYATALHLGGLSNGTSVTVGAMVPEPGWISLLGVCAAGAFAYYQRRRKHAA